MGKYFLTSNKKDVRDIDLIILRIFKDYLDDRKPKNLSEAFGEMINNFIDEKRIDENKTDKTKNFNFTNAPKYTGDFETDYVNITDYLTELYNYSKFIKNYQIEMNSYDPEIDIDNYTFKYQGDITFNDQTKRLSISDGFKNDIINRKVKISDQKANTESLLNAIETEPKDRYQAYKAYKNTLTVRNNRPKPKWYEWGKMYRNHKEKKALEKYESHLKKYGIGDNLINLAKQGKMVSKEKFDSLKVKTAEETFEKFDDLKRNLGEKDVYDNIYVKNFLDLVIEYRKIEKAHKEKNPENDLYAKKIYSDEETKLSLNKNFLTKNIGLNELFETLTIEDVELIKEQYEDKKYNHLENQVSILENLVKETIEDRSLDGEINNSFDFEENIYDEREVNRDEINLDERENRELIGPSN